MLIWFWIINFKNDMNEPFPILIIDKLGFLGNAIAEKLLEKKTIFLVSGESYSKTKIDDQNLLFIAYLKRKNKVPLIPDQTYSSILLVWNGEKEILENLPEFIKKAKKDKARLIFIPNLFYTNDNLLTEIKSLHPQIEIIIFGDLFGEALPVKWPSVINNILGQVKTNNQIKILNHGLRKVYPVFFDDALDYIVDLTIGKKLSQEKTVFLFPEHLTELSFVRQIQKIDPLIKIDFIERLGWQDNFVTPSKGEYLLEKNYFLKDKIEKVLHSKIKIDSGNHSFGEGREEEKKTKSGKNLVKSFFLFAGLTAILPLVSTLLFSALALNFLISTENAIRNGDLPLAYKSVNLSQKFFNFADVSAKPIYFTLNYFNQGKQVAGFISNFQTGEEISQGLGCSLNGLLNFKKVLTGQSKNPKEDFIEGINFLKKTKVTFEKIESQKSDFWLINNFSQKFKELNSSIELFSSTADVLPIIFGFDGEKNYLVLFQNNMELRPGGGFIGSYGILTLTKGKVSHFSIFDVYDADGQLKGHLEPPYPIRRYLPQVHWYLRDSNFEIDFSKSASSSAFFLKAETGKIVDGAIALDVTFVKNLLGALGPVSVPDYNEKVDEDNLYLLTQTHAEKDFFSGSSQKKDFLRSLLNSMIVDFSSNKKIPYLAITKILGDSISQKHLLFAFADPSIQNLFTVNNLSSSLWDNRESADDIINDFVGISEANLGVNKANYFLKRKIDHKINVDQEGNITGEVKISYKNTSSKGQWPGGDYKNYLRFILPFGANLKEIKIDGVLQKTTPAVTDFTVYEAKNFVPPKELEVEKTIENGKTIYGFLVLVPTEALKTIAISYDFPQKILPTLEAFSYNLIVFKQPGTDKDSFSLALSYPEEFKPTKLTEGGEKEEGKITYSTKLDKDLFYKINFSRK